MSSAHHCYLPGGFYRTIMDKLGKAFRVEFLRQEPSKHWFALRVFGCVVASPSPAKHAALDSVAFVFPSIVATKVSATLENQRRQAWIDLPLLTGSSRTVKAQWELVSASVSILLR